MNKKTAESIPHQLTQMLWRLYRRPEIPPLWFAGGNLPWNEPEFSARMLQEHLDQSHGAASRTAAERQLQIDWLWSHLNLQTGAKILDFTCGPGLYTVPLAQRGCQVTGIDFSPASITYARQLAFDEGVAARCDFIETDVRQWEPGGTYDAALFLYGQLAVFPPAEAQLLLNRIAQTLSPGGQLCVELLNPQRIDKKNSNWWYTDDNGLWGNKPFLHLGERFWNEAEQTATERFYILHLENGQMEEIVLCDKAYQPPEMTAMMKQAGFSHVTVHPHWADVPLYDGQEWIVYLAEKG